jgi:YfiH family protein
MKAGVRYMQFPHLAKFPELWHGIFTRHGGFSPAPFDSLNISYGLGDDPVLVRKNRRCLARAVGDGCLVFARQVHGADVLVVNGGDAQRDAEERCDRGKEPVAVGDALIANEQTRMLAIQVADCQAVMLYDPERQVVANVHAGWRGSVADVLGKTVALMQREFECDPGRIVAGIGPSLGPCCAEFVNYKQEIPPAYWKYRLADNRFNFWRITRAQLDQAGVVPTNVHASEICTRCNTGLFYSYRGEKVTGRFAAVIGLQRNAVGGPAWGRER